METVLTLKNDTKVNIQNVVYSSPAAEVLHIRKREKVKRTMYRTGRVRRFPEVLGSHVSR